MMYLGKGDENHTGHMSTIVAVQRSLDAKTQGSCSATYNGTFMGKSLSPLSMGLIFVKCGGYCLPYSTYHYLWHRHYSKHFTLTHLKPPKTCEVGPIILAVLEIRRVRHREMK